MNSITTIAQTLGFQLQFGEPFSIRAVLVTWCCGDACTALTEKPGGLFRSDKLERRSLILTSNLPAATSPERAFSQKTTSNSSRTPIGKVGASGQHAAADTVAYRNEERRIVLLLISV
jgi:hypothetical protein